MSRVTSVQRGITLNKSTKDGILSIGGKSSGRNVFNDLELKKVEEIVAEEDRDDLHLQSLKTMDPKYRKKEETSPLPIIAEDGKSVESEKELGKAKKIYHIAKTKTMASSLKMAKIRFSKTRDLSK